jgi:hypothetical protein
LNANFAPPCCCGPACACACGRWRGLGVTGVFGCDRAAVGVEGNDAVEIVLGAGVEYVLEYALGLGIAKCEGGGEAGVDRVVGLGASDLARLRFEGYLRRVAIESGKGGNTFWRPLTEDEGGITSSEASGVTGNGLLNVDVLEGVRTISDGSLEALV